MGKLVRDRIPEIIEASGKTPVFHQADEGDRVNLLCNKLVEEAAELLRAKDRNEVIEEMADIAEVYGAIQQALFISSDDIKEAVENKRAERGAFDALIVLDEVK